MAYGNQLTKRQLAVLDDLFNGDANDEQAVLDKYNVNSSLYNKWLSDDAFVEQFDARVTGLRRQSELIIARYAALAAAKLVQLTESEKEETARKACLDIISLADTKAKKAPPADNQNDAEPQQMELSQAQAGRLLAAIADENS